MPSFYKSVMGRKFFEVDVIGARNDLKSISESLREANELKAKELQLKERELQLLEQQLHIQKANR